LRWKDCQRYLWSNTPVRPNVEQSQKSDKDEKERLLFQKEIETIKKIIELEGETMDDQEKKRHNSRILFLEKESLKRQRFTPLFFSALKVFSAYHWTMGRTNGRPHVVASASNLYSYKYMMAILNIARADIKEKPKEPLKYLPQALEQLYRILQTDLEDKQPFHLSMSVLQDMYLGASAGLNYAPSVGPIDSTFKVKISNKGKKIDFFEQDMMAILDFIRTGKRPSVWWTLPPKIENFFSFTKQYSDKEYEDWCNKLRIFNIPSSIYIYLERMVSYVRHLVERGKVICVGHRWSRGGADTIAKSLGIDLSNCWKKIIVEGDGKNFDQTVRDFFVKLYFSTMGVHFDRNSPDYPAFEKICSFLLENMLDRLTHLFGDLWGIVHGGVPSGAYNTSHMDSWIMALYFCLFMVFQVATAPIELQPELELHMLAQLYLIVYGDDHLYNKGEGPSSLYFSGTLFAKFMWDHFEVEIRDVKDGIPFCSKHSNGFVTQMGATYLRHQFVLNENKAKGQSTFFTL